MSEDKDTKAIVPYEKKEVAPIEKPLAKRLRPERHVRVIMTNKGRKAILVNPEIQRFFPPVKRHTDIEKNPTIEPPRIHFRPKTELERTTWTNILKVDTKLPSLISKKEEEEIQSKLKPGERYALAVNKVTITPADKEEGAGYISIDITNEQGKPETIRARLTDEYNIVTIRFLQYLKSIEGKHKKIIFKMIGGKGGEMKPEDFLKKVLQYAGNKDALDQDEDMMTINGPMGAKMVMDAPLDMAYIRDYGTGATFKKEIKKEHPLMTFGQPDGSVILSEVDNEGRPIGENRIFPDLESLNRAFMNSAMGDVDVLGRPHDTQTGLGRIASTQQMLEDPFVKSGADMVMNQYYITPYVTEITVFEKDGKFKLFFLDAQRQIIPSLTNIVDSMEEVRRYATETAYNYQTGKNIIIPKNANYERPTVPGQQTHKPKYVFSRPLKNKVITEAKIEYYNGKYITKFFNRLGRVEDIASQPFRDINSAKQYINDVEKAINER